MIQLKKKKKGKRRMVFREVSISIVKNYMVEVIFFYFFFRLSYNKFVIGCI